MTRHISCFYFLILISFFRSDVIEGRWHLVGYEDNVMYQFEDSWRYSIYSLDGVFGDLEDAGGSPNPYTIEDDIITLDLFFGTIVSYQMVFGCSAQVVEFRSVLNGAVHSVLFREGYDYVPSGCEEFSDDCTDGEINNENPCNPMECWDGEWFEIIIDCAEWFGVPCDGGVYIPPPDDQCCSECVAFGDINQDTNLNVLDIVSVVDIILNGTEYNIIADINLDGEINIVDVVLLVNNILDS